MNNQNILNLLIAISFSTLLAACAAAPSAQATHYWQAEKAKTEREYSIDHGACHEQYGTGDSNPMRPASPSFEAYRQCMVEKGYVLRSY